MQQVWRYRLWGTGCLKTSQGKDIQILEAGKLNTGPGPDFSDARIRVGDKIWVGAVEIHRRASDWHRHGHDGDPAYDNVVLHVVGMDDCRIHRADGAEILQTVMRIDDGFADMFNGLLVSSDYVLPMCGRSLGNVASIFKTDWLTALAFERMQRKAADIMARIGAEGGNKLQAVFITLARGLGFGINADNMERMARATPFRILLKHTDRPEIVEAILFGQAGLLNVVTPADEYERLLAREYAFYAVKYGLTPIERPYWQMSVRNMTNTPYRRIALLAALICRHTVDLGNSLCNKPDIDYIRSYLGINVSEYWAYSFAFGRTSATRMGALGKQSRDLLIINVLAPLVYAEGLANGNHTLMERAISLWDALPPEQNGITRGFAAHNVMAPDAFTSQALIQLHKEYCERRRCPDCRLGYRLLTQFISIDAVNK